jgi:hypothetical protein
MSLTPRQVTTLAHDLAGRSETAITEALQARHLSPEEKIAVRHQMQAQAVDRRISASLATDRALTIGRMATDTVAYPPGMSEIDRLLTKLGADLSGYRRLTERELDAKLTEAGITDPTERIAIKTELISRKLIPQPRPTLQAGRDLRAAAAPRPKGQILRDATGTPLVLRLGPH